MTKVDKAARFLEQQLITDVPLRVVRAAAALAPDHSAVAGRLLAGIEAAARHDRVSSLRHVDEARRLWAVDEAARRLCAPAAPAPIVGVEYDPHAWPIPVRYLTILSRSDVAPFWRSFGERRGRQWVVARWKRSGLLVAGWAVTDRARLDPREEAAPDGA